MIQKKRLNTWIFLVAISLLATLWLQAPRLLDQFQVDQDFRFYYWMNKFQDTTIFPNISAYTSINLLGVEIPFQAQSPGYGLVFYIATFFVTPVFFSKLLVFIILPLTVIYLFEFGRVARDRNTGLALALLFLFLNLASPSSTSIVPGLQRSFGASLVIIQIYYLQRQKYVGAAIAVVISALIYAPMFVFGVVIWALFLIKITRKPKLKLSIDYRGIALLLLATLLSFMVMAPLMLPRITQVFIDKNPEVISEQNSDTNSEPIETTSNSYKYLWENPIYREGGQYPLFFLFPIVGRGGLVNNGEEGVHVLILLSLSVLIFLVRGRKALKLPYVIWCALWAGLILFVLSWGVIWLTNSLLLYLPSRYTRIGLFLFFLVFVVWNAKDTVSEAIVLIRRNPKSLQWVVGVVGILALALVFLYPSELSRIGGFNMKWLLAPTALIFIALAIAVIRRPASSVRNVSTMQKAPGGRLFWRLIIAVLLVGWAIYAPIVSKVDFLDPPPEERVLLEFLKTLPKDVLLAGTPLALDNVPLFAKRQVLFNHDLGGADGNTIHEALTAYYSGDPQTVVDFCQKYNVDYLVIDTQTYTQDYLSTQNIYFEPYNQVIRSQIAAQDTFVLAHLPDASKSFTAGPFVVIKCDKETILSQG